MSFKLNSLKRVLPVAAVAVSLNLASCSDFLQQIGAADDDRTQYELLSLFAPCGNLAVLSGALGTQTVPSTGACIVGNAFVPSGATLTVNGGTTIYGTQGSALFVLRGGKLVATGSAANPVVFTSSQPAGFRASGDWGGIVMIGGASTNAGVRRTEGTEPQNFGGLTSNNDNDSSGTLRYVRIEFAGFPVTEGNELNGLSMYAVGRGTTLEYIQSHMGKDDAFEWYGGAVNAKYLLSTGTADDDFDIDVGYHGKLQFLIAQRYADGSTGLGSTDPRMIEWNGRENGSLATSVSEGAYPQNGNPTIANMTLIMPNLTPSPGGYLMGRARVGMGGFASNIAAWKLGGGGVANCQDTGTNMDFRHVYAGPAANQATFMAGGTCTFAGDQLVGGTNPGTQPYISAATESGGIPDYRPAGGMPATSSTLKSASAFNDVFFTDNSTFGGMLSGDNWITGWTNFANR